MASCLPHLFMVVVKALVEAQAGAKRKVEAAQSEGRGARRSGSASALAVWQCTHCQ